MTTNTDAMFTVAEPRDKSPPPLGVFNYGFDSEDEDEGVWKPSREQEEHLGLTACKLVPGLKIGPYRLLTLHESQAFTFYAQKSRAGQIYHPDDSIIIDTFPCVIKPQSRAQAEKMVRLARLVEDGMSEEDDYDDDYEEVERGHQGRGNVLLKSRFDDRDRLAVRFRNLAVVTGRRPFSYMLFLISPIAYGCLGTKISQLNLVGKSLEVEAVRTIAKDLARILQKLHKAGIAIAGELSLKRLVFMDPGETMIRLGSLIKTRALEQQEIKARIICMSIYGALYM